MIKDFDIIVYHGSGCPDGISALKCALMYADIKIKYGCKAGVDPNIDHIDKSILFVDICPSITYLTKIAKESKQIVILDHHKSTLDTFNKNKDNVSENIIFILDMDRAGCQITWDYFFPNKPRPWFIDYVADRDLWKWLLPNSKAINTAYSYNDYFNTFNLDKLNELIEPSDTVKQKLLDQGIQLIKIQQKELDFATGKAIEGTMKVNDIQYHIWIGTISSELRSDLGNILANKKLSNGNQPDFSATWSYDLKADIWNISFRGTKNGPDLSAICKLYGGGGHYCASGMSIKGSLRDIFIIK